MVKNDRRELPIVRVGSTICNVIVLTAYDSARRRRLSGGVAPAPELVAEVVDDLVGTDNSAPAA